MSTSLEKELDFVDEVVDEILKNEKRKNFRRRVEKRSPAKLVDYYDEGDDGFTNDSELSQDDAIEEALSEVVQVWEENNESPITNDEVREMIIQRLRDSKLVS